MVPWLSTEIERTVFPSKVMLRVELAVNPEAVKTTAVPGGPVDGVREKNEFSVKFSLDTPIISTAYEPCGRGGTTNEKVNDPEESAAKVPNWSSPNARVIPPWLAANPSPLAMTCDPTLP
jgi:hypothetical protein